MVETNPLDRILDILGTEDKFEAQTKLQEKFGEEKIEQAVNQWSVLCAWSWLEPDDYPDAQKPSDDEEKLRLAFIKAIKATALTLIKEHYKPGASFKEITARSNDLSNILNGTEPKNYKIKLPELYKKITSKKDYVFTKELTNSFLWLTSVDRFNGMCAGYLPEQKKIVQILAYPPRPIPSTLSTQELIDWSEQKKTKEEYYPATPYIPTCNC
jgi:hypothetical protein